MTSIQITPQTINTWLKNQSFKALVNQRTEKLNNAFINELIRLRLLSLYQLTDVLESGKPSERLHAVKIILATINGSLRE